MNIRPESVKKQIFKRILALCAPLKQGPFNFRKIERTNNLWALATAQPELVIYAGQDVRTEEDYQGYTFEFPVFFKASFETGSNVSWDADDLEAWIQTAIESDQQLSGLANFVLPESTLPFVNEIIKPDAGILLTYSVTYRRFKGNPAQNY